MSENIIAKVLKGIGIGTIAVGIIASLILGNSADEITITIGGIIGSIISGMLFIGFSEVINLLQQNTDNQETIIRQLKEKPKTVINNSSTTKITTTSSNNTPAKHLFRCDNCGKMIEEYPCCECGYKFN